MRVLASLAAMLLTAQTTPAAEVILGDIEVRLFYKATDRLPPAASRR